MEAAKESYATRLAKPAPTLNPMALPPVSTTNRLEDTSASVSNSKTTTTKPDMNFIPVISSNDIQYLYNLYENAVVYLSQSPLKLSNRRKGIDGLFDLLSEATLVNHPILHAMAHTTIAVNTRFDGRNHCKYKLDHLEKAQDIAVSVLRERHGRGKEEGGCQGCMYARLQQEAGKGAGEADASECNSLVRLGGVIESESRRVASFNWGELDHLLV